MEEKRKDITYVPATVQFEGFDAYRKRAEAVAAYIGSITLTDDNVQEVKKTLADARRLVNALEDRRKEIKKEIMAPYKVLEEQVKILTGIIDDADSVLRSQIREMEERARDEKKQLIVGLWDMRIMQYSFGKYVPDAFDFWLEPKHLNKSTSMKAVEKEMTDFMETVEKDVTVILAMPDAEEVMLEYAGTLNIADALEAVRKQKEYREKVFDEPVSEEQATFVIRGKANITLTEKLLKENGIEFRRI